MAGGKKLPQYIAASCICIGAMAMGTALGWTLNITKRLKDGELNGVKMDTNELRWVICVMTLGAMFTCIPVGIFTDMFGRKPVSLILVLPFVIGWLLITFGDQLIMIYIGRILTGVGAGGFCVTAPMYTTEIAEVEIRGILGTFFYLFITLGILFNCVFSYFLNLKIYNICCLIIPLVFGVLFAFQPESPVYYLQQGNRDRAVKSFSRLRGSEYDASGEIAAIQAEIDREKALGGFWQAMKTKASKKATLICFGLMFYQQSSGIYAVIFYSYDILEKLGINPVEYWCIIIIGIVPVLVSLFLLWAVEQYGRQLILLFISALMPIEIALLGLVFTLKEHKLLNLLPSFILGQKAMLMGYLTIFSIGFGPIPWLATGELFTPNIKGKLTACVGTFHWFLAFLVTKLYMSIYPIIGIDVTFYIFSILTITSSCFVYLMMPEPQGKAIQEIVELLESRTTQHRDLAVADLPLPWPIGR